MDRIVAMFARRRRGGLRLTAGEIGEPVGVVGGDETSTYSVGSVTARPGA